MADEESLKLKLPNKMRKINRTEISSDYGKLMSVIKKKLKEVKPDMSDFYIHVVSIFEPEDISRVISDECDIDHIFNALTKHRLWGFGDISQLKSIAKRFIEVDGSLRQIFSDYNFKLNGYKATTKIIERIRSDEMKERDDFDDSDEYESVVSNASKYNKKYRHDLSVKLFSSDDGNVRLAMKSLEYIETIWNELCDEFEMSLPPVLDKIVEGCIEITWLVPSALALKVLGKMHEAIEFFQRKFISNILLEGIVVYSASYGVAQKV